MTRRQITGFSNPTVKALRAFREKKHRKREGRFLAEGLRLLTDARENGRIPETLVMAEGRDPHPLIDALEQAVERLGGEVIEVPVEIMEKRPPSINLTRRVPNVLKTLARLFIAIRIRG